MVSNEDLLAAIDAARENAYGSEEQSVLGQKRARAIEYFFGLNTNPAPEGRSQVVDRSVYETISVMLPSLVRIFAGSSDEVCKCVAIGPDDEQAAEQQTAVLNHVVTQQNQWEQIIADWILDAMLMSNGYAMAYWDESDNTVQEVYEGQSDDQLAALLSDKSVKVLEHSESIDQQATAEAQEQYKQHLVQYKQMLAQGQQVPPPPKPQPVILHDLVIERKENEGKVCIRVLPPEHCYISSDTPDWTLRDCPYFEYGEPKPIAELRSMGLDVPEDINDDADADTDEDWARDRFGEDREEDSGKGVMRRVWARMIWIRVDDEGKSRLYYVIAVGKTILFAQPVSRIPVSSMTPQPLPHRHIGMAVGETIHDLQDIRTAVKRGGLDNLYLANNGRHAISSKVSLEDFLEARPGGVVRMLDDSLPAEGHILPIAHPFAFNEIIGTLEYFDQERQNRTGASRYFSGTDAGAINKTAAGTAMLQNSASMRVEHLGRTMAPAVEELFSAVQEIVSKHQNKAMTIKIRGGQWVTVDPQAWRTKRDVRISVGVGAGNKESMMAQLGMIYGAQLQLLPVGLAGPPQIHATVTEMAKLAGFANPGKFWLDPATQPPMPQPPSPEQIKAQADMQMHREKLQLEAEKFQADMQGRMRELEAQHALKVRELQANMELQAANDERDALREQRKAELDAQVQALAEQNKREIAAMQAEMDKYKADLDAQVKLAIAQKQVEQQAHQAEQQSIQGAEQKASSDGIQEALKGIMEHMTQPAEIVRDETGRAVGVKRGETTRLIKRGPDGKAIGLQ